MTPVMRQYHDLKAQNPDCLLFFRLGDFYEMFGEDAVFAADVLGLTLTTRDRNAPEDERIPMCGVPYMTAESYIARLVAKGINVALCEQIDPPSGEPMPKLIERKVVRVYTPGTLIESSMLQEDKNNYLCGVVTAGTRAGIGFADLSTGEIFATESAVGDIPREIERFAPREVLLSAEAADKLEISVPYQVFDAADTFEFSALQSRPLAQKATAHVVAYAKQHVNIPFSFSVVYYDAETYMGCDPTARRNLEITAGINTGAKADSLLGVLDKTVTSSGSRMLRSWLEKPLRSPAAIQKRHNIVEAFVGDAERRAVVRDTLRRVSDTERLLTRIIGGTAAPRDLVSLGVSLGALPDLCETLAGWKTIRGAESLCARIVPIPEVSNVLSAALCDDPPAKIADGGFVRAGYNKNVDEARELKEDSGKLLASLEAQEREATGIAKLKVGYNRVFGYYLEIPRRFSENIPTYYHRKQTLATTERFITEELHRLEQRIYASADRLLALERDIFEELCALIVSYAVQIKNAAAAMAEIDALAAFAEVAVLNRYVRPDLNAGDEIQIEEGRHPVVEMFTDGLFVPNNIHLSSAEPTLILTGPNMAGKSTYMRQVALIVILAQSGSFVPAKAARIGVVDCIFTRIGASDDVAGGRSTFMVEMTEVSNILQNATERSLLILDEVGRGTSTYDGISVAEATLEHIHTKIRAKTLFATHYHELTALADVFAGMKNFCVVCKKKGEEIQFLRRIVPGAADDSFGVEVARLAGLPPTVIRRARLILQDLENGNHDVHHDAKSAPESQQVSFASLSAQNLAERVKAIDVETLTPLEALNLLYALCKDARAM